MDEPKPLANVDLTTSALSHAGADNQTWAVLLAAWILGVLSSVGLECRALLMREAIWTPLILIIAYLFIVGFCQAGLEDFRKSRVKLSFNGRRQRVRPRKANQAVSDAVESLAAQIGLKAPKVFVIPRIYHAVDAYAVGNHENPVIVMTGGLALLSTRDDAESRSQFEFIVRHELAHLLRSDPAIFATIAAILGVSIAVLVLKLLFIGFLGVERTAQWYRPILPRSFLSVANQELIQYSLPGRTVLATVLTTNVLLLLLLALLYWLWVRKREYWADRAAIDSSGDESIGAEALERALTGTHAEDLRLSGTGKRRFWHPRTSARIRVAKSKTPRRGIYTGTASLLMLSTIFIFRYVLGNNSGFGTADYPNSFPIFALSILYFLIAYFSVELLVFPIGNLRGKGSRARNLISLITVTGVSLIVTFIAMGADGYWTMLTSRENAPGKVLTAISGEMFERQLLLFSLGISVMIFAVIAYLRGQFLRKVSAVFGVPVAAVILFGLSHWGGQIVAVSRTKEMSTPNEDAQFDPKRALAGLAHKLVGLEGGMYPFRPPLDVFTLNRGPNSVPTLNDERLAGSMGLVLREQIKALYSDLKKRTQLPEMDDYTVLSYFGDLFPETSDKEKVQIVEALANRQPLTGEQSDQFTRGLYGCVLQSKVECVLLAGALGADFRRQWVDIVARERNLVSTICDRAPLSEPQLQTLLVLLQGGADPNVGAGLIDAVNQGDLLTTLLLLKHGANPNVTRAASPELKPISDARTPLQAAVLLYVTDPDDKNSLHLRGEVTLKKKESIVELLLNHHADVNAAPQFAITPLMMAADRCEPSVIRLLVAQGADKLLRDYREQSAYDYAHPPVDKLTSPVQKVWASAKLESAQCRKAAKELSIKQ